MSEPAALTVKFFQIKSKTMKAIMYQQYGSPEVLEYAEVAKPTPKANEVLIKVVAASVNPLDWHFMRGTPKFMRLLFGLSKPKHKLLGADAAGVVEAVGKDVSQLKPGDAVFGAPFVLGSLAEYVCIPEEVLALKPANISFEEAAAVPVAAITGLQALQTGRILAGQKVLVNGAAGGVGTFTVQIAKAFGAEVTGVCSTRNVEMVRSLGADHVIDYTQESFAQQGKVYDLVIDNVGNKTIADYKAVLKPGGTCVVVGYTNPSLLLHHMVTAPIVSLLGKEKIGMMKTAQLNKKDMGTLRELLEKGKIKAVIDKRYPLAETAAAISYLEEGHARSKVVINVNQS